MQTEQNHTYQLFHFLIALNCELICLLDDILEEYEWMNGDRYRYGDVLIACKLLSHLKQKKEFCILFVRMRLFLHKFVFFFLNV